MYIGFIGNLRGGDFSNFMIDLLLLGIIES